MKRRELVAGGVSLSVAGCLRLTESDGGDPGADASTDTGGGTADAGSTASERGESGSGEAPETTRASAVRSSVIEAPESFVVGRTERVAVRVANDRDRTFAGEVRLELDGEVRDATSVDVRSRTATTVSFDVTLRSLETRTLRVLVTGDDYERVLVDQSLAPGEHLVTVEWGESYVPAEDPESDSNDDRVLAFYCRELVLERGGEQLASYDVGVFDDEPPRLEGKYGPEENDRGTWRWFGGPDERTRIGFEPELLASAQTLRFVGHLPPKPEEMPVTVQVGDLRTDRAMWTDANDEYVVSLEPDG